MKIPFIDLKSQYNALEVEIKDRINTVLEHGQFIMGPEVTELESNLETYTGSKYCISVASGTEALLISLMSLGVKSGDEVITTPFTFVATAEVIAILGAIPIFVDIDPETCNIDASKIEERITSKTKAIIPVSLYGQPADMNEINEIAKRNGDIPVIEDAAQSFGSVYGDKKSCNLSTIGCTSFFPSKPLGCYGDGGAIFTNQKEIAEACREIRVHGQSERYVHTRVGVGGRMDTIQCSIVLAKLGRFDWEVKSRQKIGQRYTELLNSLKGEKSIEPITIRSDRSSVFAQYTVLISDRDKIQEKLRSEGIPTAVHYPIPLNEQKAYRHYCCDNSTPISKSNANRVISLPMSPDMSPETQEMIVEKLIKYI